MSQLRATKCKTITSATTACVFTTGELMTTYRAQPIDGPTVKPNFIENYEKCRLMEGFKHFLIDEADLTRMKIIWAECKTAGEKDLKTFEYLGSVTKFLRDFKKKIYVRMFPSKNVSIKGSSTAMRVFTDEFLEIIPVVLKQQGSPIAANDARLNRYRNEWNSGFPNRYTTIDTDRFERVLEEFGIYKQLITLFQDMPHDISVKIGDMVRFFSPDMKIVTDSCHAADHIWTTLVMGVNWKKLSCPDKDSRIEKVKKLVIEMLDIPRSMAPGAVITWELISKMIDDVKEDCRWNYSGENKCPDYKLVGVPHDAQADIKIYIYVTSFFDLPTYVNFLPNRNPGAIPIWMFRFFCKLGWIQQFFSTEEHSKNRDMIVEAALFAVPNEHMVAARGFVNTILNLTQVARQSQSPKPRSTENRESSSGGRVIDGFEKMLANALKRRKEAEKQKNGGSK
ncbi:hypothetical protein GCK72_010904 [Caenorhabditis remanei]|uniref:Uncharacterized protein n=1 Tax=Caenorhabditis remanei TaxID=31234 RepID=A0A6A5H8G9_CAERE|nr:hypothetical protein GCK72_010904 [Caenorhabditis remanei]KAF1762642.1 hypothetical protein GCK72_010904 [Caenorhabditis remanei]